MLVDVVVAAVVSVSLLVVACASAAFDCVLAVPDAVVTSLCVDGVAGEADGDGECDLCSCGDELLLPLSVAPCVGPDLCELRNTRWWLEPLCSSDWPGFESFFSSFEPEDSGLAFPGGISLSVESLLFELATTYGNGWARWELFLPLRLVPVSCSLLPL